MSNADQRRFCTTCGTQLGTGAAFCTNCGKSAALHNDSGMAPNPVNTSTINPQNYSQQSYAQQGYSGQAAPPGYAYPQIFQKKNVNIGLFAFVGLALLALLLFIFAAFPLYVTVIGLFVIAAAFVLQQKLARKRLLAGIALWFGAALICFILIGVFNPSAFGAGGTMQTVISPSDKDTTVLYGTYTIVIPGGTVEKKETLVVKPMTAMTQAITEFEPVCPAFDVKLGDLTKFEAPIIINIPYDSTKIKDTDPSGAFIAVFYDEQSGKWVDVPYEVDKNASVIKLMMHHLTTVQCYYSYWEGAYVYDNGDAEVIYDISADLAPKYSSYDQFVSKSSGEKTKPQFVIDIADNASMILKAYAGEGLSVPAHPKIYVVAGNSTYNSITGNVSVSIDVTTLDDPLGLMKRNLAHELFHVSQQLGTGSFDYMATSYKNVSFWLEATADYMANTGVWNILGQPPISKYDSYALDFFSKGLYTMDGAHEYEAASFVSHIQQAQSATPKQLIDMTEKYTSFPGAFSSVYGGINTLDDCYRDFLEYSIADATSNLSASSNAKLESQITAKVNLEFKLDENGNAVQPAEPQEGSASLIFPDAYTAGFCIFKTNCDTTLTVTPGSDIILYQLDRTAKGRVVNLRVMAYGGAPTEMTFGKNTYIMALQTSPQAGSVSIKYRAEPALPDFAGQWNMTSMVETDVEASGDFWAAILSSFGYDKSSYMAEINAGMQERIQGMSIQITKTGEGDLYTVGLSTSSGDIENLQFNDITVLGNTLQGGTQFSGLWGSISLTINGNVMTGTLRAQMTYTSGDAVVSGTEVFSFEAMRPEPPTQ